MSSTPSNGCAQSSLVSATQMAIQHREEDIGQQITDEINSDPEEVERLRRAIQQSREGKRRRLDDTC
jgi:hypothetical protein